MRGALATLPWVGQVQTDIRRRQAVVRVQAAGYDPAALLRALAHGGYSGSIIDEQ